ncbi:hypothetical protein C4577_06565 [Candidatus Parcubacteria bacterium]|nr:MAG: hypothetical protein C4577_06565 [Candidatus Parcubacteria bacterium]
MAIWTGNESSFKVQTEVEIPLPKMRDLLVSALEGGSNYWVDQLKFDFGDKKKEECVMLDEYSEEPLPLKYVLPFFPGTSLLIKPVEERKYYELNLTVICHGLQEMANVFPVHFKNILEDNDDAETADVFLQVALFGELVYG